jgi:hypothetical protein
MIISACADFNQALTRLLEGILGFKSTHQAAYENDH